MTNINELNSIFTELNPEDAESIHGGKGWLIKYGNNVYKYKRRDENSHQHFAAIVHTSDGNGTYENPPDVISFTNLPSFPNRARNQTLALFDNKDIGDGVWVRQRDL